MAPEGIKLRMPKIKKFASREEICPVENRFKSDIKQRRGKRILRDRFLILISLIIFFLINTQYFIANAKMRPINCISWHSTLGL